MSVIVKTRTDAAAAAGAAAAAAATAALFILFCPCSICSRYAFLEGEDWQFCVWWGQEGDFMATFEHPSLKINLKH